MAEHNWKKDKLQVEFLNAIIVFFVTQIIELISLGITYGNIFFSEHTVVRVITRGLIYH